MADQQAALGKTPLYDLHVALGARMVPFAGYEMPVQYPAGILTEHHHTRAQAGLFDVSHMGQVRLIGAGAGQALERLVPGDILGLGTGRLRYSMLTNERGGIIDDLMITATEDGLFLVINAGRKQVDLAHLTAHLDGVEIEVSGDRALLALQGPAAAAVMARLAPETAALKFMTMTNATIGGTACMVSRCGYTGEDGFEVSIPGDGAQAVARLLLGEPEVEPVGLGARDSLRLEAGLCLYGNDIDDTTTPIEAGLAWTIAKRRRQDGGFLGAGTILAQLADGPKRKRIGLHPEGRAPAREHTPIVDDQGRQVGEITSGGFGPTVGGPVAMGYVERDFAAKGTRLGLMVRGKERPATVCAMPFTPHRYAR